MAPVVFNNLKIYYGIHTFMLAKKQEKTTQ